MADDQYSALTQEEIDAINKKAMLSDIVGGVGQAFANQHSAGEYFLGQPRSNIDIPSTDVDKLQKRAMLQKYLKEKPLRDAAAKQEKLDLAKAKLAETIASEDRAFSKAKELADYKGNIDLKKEKLQAYLKSKAEPKQKEFKDWEWKNADFAQRMMGAAPVLEQFDDPKYTKTTMGLSFVDQGRGIVPEFAKTEEFKNYANAKRAFKLAVLRKDTGATISAKEDEEVEKDYFPQPGDSQSNIDQKAAKRANITKAMAMASGGAFDVLAPSLNLGRAQEKKDDSDLSLLPSANAKGGKIEIPEDIKKKSREEKLKELRGY